MEMGHSICQKQQNAKFAAERLLLVENLVQIVEKMYKKVAICNTLMFRVSKSTKAAPSSIKPEEGSYLKVTIRKTFVLVKTVDGAQFTFSEIYWTIWSL